MKLVTFGVPTPVGQIQRIGAKDQDQIIDLNMGYTRYLAGKYGNSVAYKLAAAMLPPDMVGFFRRGEEGRDKAGLAMDYAAEYQVKGSLAGPRGEKIVYGMGEVKLKGTRATAEFPSGLPLLRGPLQLSSCESVGPAGRSRPEAEVA